MIGAAYMLKYRALMLVRRVAWSKWSFKIVHDCDWGRPT